VRVPYVLIDAVADAEELGQARRHSWVPADLRGNGTGALKCA
jgi:hypothetical protein